MLRILAFLLAFPAMAVAQDLPVPLTDTLSDFANLLTPNQEAALTARLQAARNDTGVHIVVVTMGRIADYGGNGQSIERYGKTLFNDWGIGDATRNDGILMLVARDDREMRIALGAGYDPVYDGLARPFAAHETPAPAASEPLGAVIWLVIAGFGAVFLGIVGVILRPFIGDMTTRFRPCPQCGAKGLHRHRDILNVATTALAGNGVQITRCTACSYEQRDSYVIPVRSEHSSGGSSGFGGGGSSGGGASGKW